VDEKEGLCRKWAKKAKSNEGVTAERCDEAECLVDGGIGLVRLVKGLRSRK
jgi:hypothetical protein